MQQHSRWFSKKILVVLGMLVLSMGGVAPAFAAKCECFCGDQEQGAGSIGAKESTSECAAKCADGDATYVGCFTDESLYPKNNNLCWTKDECETYPITIDGDAYNGTWSSQNAFCSKEAVTGAAMGYCYGPLLPVTLNVPILGVTKISNLGTYVNLVYTYAIPIAGIFGVLMFVIAGFQYMTAGGDRGAVTKAKTRMTNTVTGLILLMTVYAIAYLIDPRLTRFNELRPPLVKKAVLIDESTSCEALFGYGFCIDGNCPSDSVSSIWGTCGLKGIITGDDGVIDTIVNPPALGDDCLYAGCSEKGKACVIKGDNSGGVCVACAEASSLNNDTGLTPSQTVCAEIEKQAQAKDNNPDHLYSCYFDNDFSEFSGADATGADECVAFYTNNDAYINCNTLEVKAKNREDGCDAYEYVNADSYGVDLSAGVAELFDAGSADQIEDFKNVFGSLCKQDVCNLADAGKVPQGSCDFVDTNWVEDYLDSFSGIGAIFDVFDDYGCAGAVTLSPESEDSSSSAQSADAYEYYTP